MASTMKSISQALGSVDGKKENLRKAFEDLQSHSSSLSSFTLQWKDLEDHFDSIKKSIEQRFKELEGKTNQSSAEKKSSTSTSTPPTAAAATPTPTPAKEKRESNSNSHPELKSLCEKMDGIGLRSYILSHRKDLASIRNEVGIALQSASDPAKLVLDAMKGFYPPNSKGDKDGELAALRRTCLLLLEQLLGVSPQIKPDIKERAKKLAVEWKGKVSSGGDNPLEPLTLLQLLATYGLVSALSGDELLDMAVSIARRKQAVDLIRSLGIPDKIPDFIQKLTSSGKQLDAVKFVYAFELVDKFPPVPLLKEYFKQSKKVAQEIRNKGNHSVQSLNEATAKEIAALRSIVKCIEEHNLESEYPRGPLDKRVEQLEKQKADKKRPAAGSTPGDKKNQQHSGNKRPRPMASRNASSNAPISQNHLQPVSSLMDRYPSYMSSSAQYGLAGPTPAVPSYMTSAAGPYGLVGNPVSSYGLGGNPGSSYGMNLSPPRPNPYSSESHMPGGLYDRSMGYGGHGMPPSHRSSFYP